ncbi:MAG: glucose-1-phosphate adenylyltransferase subunit GlgD [Oscillospiraceae bacterium]
MLTNKALGIIFANMHDDMVGEMTEIRSMASLPFGGRYRLIDFYLSSLVNAGVTKVGVIAKHNYQSLLDHLGSGRSWDLARKRSGLSIFPPNSLSQEGTYHGRVQALHNVIRYIKYSSEKYVVLMDCDNVCNIDFTDVLNRHAESGADVTIVSRGVVSGEDMERNSVLLHSDDTGRVREMLFDRYEGGCTISMDIFVISRDKLVELVETAISRMQTMFERDVLLKGIDTLNIREYKFGGFVRRVYSTKSYYEANMALLEPKNMDALFTPERPVYTKVRDEAPVRYGIDAKVTNSLIADGCVILGEVENCMIFRGVTVGKHTKVKNSIIMQDTIISERSELSFVITDKDVVINPDRSLMGHENYPLYIKKFSNI